MINNINSYNSLVNTASTTAGKSEIDSIIEKHKESSAEKATETKSSQNNLYLSSRAQKINAISKEFFTGDALNFNDVESLKERVYQLGLISKNDYAKLTKSSAENDVSSSNNENSTLGLTNFIGDLLARLQASDSESTESNSTETETETEDERSKALSSLIKTLEAAKSIISNIEEAKNQANFKSTLQETLSTLKAAIEAPSFEKIPLDDKRGLGKVYQTLEIVDQLSPQRLNNEKINKYLDLSYR